MNITTAKGRIIRKHEGDLAGANLKGLNLSGANLQGLNLRGTNFSQTTLNGASLEDADLSGANLTEALLEGATCCETIFENALMVGADLYWAFGYRASFKNAVLRQAMMNGANLTEADFRGADLHGANFGKDRLGGSTSLQGANFLETNVVAATLAGALYDETTQFPKGFDPKRQGLILHRETSRDIQ